MKLPPSLNVLASRVQSRIGKLIVLWSEWNVQTLLIASLSFQLILILLGSFRKQTTNPVFIVFVWLSYLLADWVAAQAVGLISKSPEHPSRHETRAGELFAFWAQFLLLHLGGPDTITALALEDNNLWVRTGLHLGVQAYTTLGILIKSIRQSSLWAPTILKFLAGIFKYVERVMALLGGRLVNFDRDPDDFAEALAAFEPPISFAGPQKERTDVEMVRDAFYLFEYYKGMYADRQFSYTKRVRSKRYFNWIGTPEKTFKVLEIQFNFAYEALYTKLAVTRTTFWKILRPVVMLFVFWCFSKKHGFKGFEIRVTYALLIGAIAVDVVAILRLQLSYWSIAHLPKGSTTRKRFYNKLLSARNRTWGRYWRKEKAAIWPHRFQVIYASEQIKEAHLSTVRALLDANGEYEIILLRWHIITELCFLQDDADKNIIQLREICKALSNYMIYLLIYQPVMMSTVVAGTKQIFQAARHKINIVHKVLRSIKEIGRVGQLGWRDMLEKPTDQGQEGGGRSQIPSKLDVIIFSNSRSMTELKFSSIEDGDAEITETRVDLPNSQIDMEVHNSSVFPFPIDPIMEELTALKGTAKWKFMAEVWAELVYYAAIRCKPSAHAAQLKQGGELLSFVWLLMVQLGFGLFLSGREATELIASRNTKSEHES